MLSSRPLRTVRKHTRSALDNTLTTDQSDLISPTPDQLAEVLAAAEAAASAAAAEDSVEDSAEAEEDHVVVVASAVAVATEEEEAEAVEDPEVAHPARLSAKVRDKCCEQASLPF
jgi:hypothetical protein